MTNPKPRKPDPRGRGTPKPEPGSARTTCWACMNTGRVIDIAPDGNAPGPRNGLACECGRLPDPEVAPPTARPQVGPWALIDHGYWSADGPGDWRAEVTSEGGRWRLEVAGPGGVRVGRVEYRDSPEAARNRALDVLREQGLATLSDEPVPNDLDPATATPEEVAANIRGWAVAAVDAGPPTLLDAAVALADAVGALDAPGAAWAVVPGNMLNMADDIRRAAAGKALWGNWATARPEPAPVTAPRPPMPTLASTAGKLWAETFLRHYAVGGNDFLSADTMRIWFANAIMTGSLGIPDDPKILQQLGEATASRETKAEPAPTKAEPSPATAMGPGFWLAEGLSDDLPTMWLVTPDGTAWGRTFNGTPATWAYRAWGRPVSELLAAHPNAVWTPEDRTVDYSDKPGGTPSRRAEKDDPLEIVTKQLRAALDMDEFKAPEQVLEAALARIFDINREAAARRWLLDLCHVEAGRPDVNADAIALQHRIVRTKIHELRAHLSRITQEHDGAQRAVDSAQRERDEAERSARELTQRNAAQARVLRDVCEALIRDDVAASSGFPIDGAASRFPIDGLAAQVRQLVTERDEWARVARTVATGGTVVEVREELQRLMQVEDAYNTAMERDAGRFEVEAANLRTAVERLTRERDEARTGPGAAPCSWCGRAAREHRCEGLSSSYYTRISEDIVEAQSGRPAAVREIVTPDLAHQARELGWIPGDGTLISWGLARAAAYRDAARERDEARTALAEARESLALYQSAAAGVLALMASDTTAHNLAAALGCERDTVEAAVRALQRERDLSRGEVAGLERAVRVLSEARRG